MRIHVAEAVWLDDQGVCSIDQLTEISGLSADEINDLIENGVIAPIDANAPTKSFQLRSLVTARAARRLRDDFELDRQGVALALKLLRRIDDLQGELAAAQAKYRRIVDGLP